MSTSGTLLTTIGPKVMRMISDRDYCDAVEEMFSLPSAQAIYLTAVVMEGLNPQIARKFVETAKNWLDLHDVMDRKADMEAGQGARRGR